MLCLRRTALRVLSSSPSVSVSISASKARSIAYLKSPIYLNSTRKTASLHFQPRFYATEIDTQAEPADTDADANTPTSAEEADEGDAASEVEPATEDAVDGASSTVAESVGSTAQTAGEVATGTAQSLGSAAESDHKVVYVGNLFFDVKIEDLRTEFERAGPIADAKIITDPRGFSKGFGYITFENAESAQRAIELFNLQNYEGRRLSVQHSQSRSGSLDRSQRFAQPGALALNPATRTLFIGNMSFEMSDRDLNNLFREVKNVVDVRVAIDRRTGQPRGFAHADFKDMVSAENALKELSGKVVCGRALRVDFSQTTGRAAVGSS